MCTVRVLWHESASLAGSPDHRERPEVVCRAGSDFRATCVRHHGHWIDLRADLAGPFAKRASYFMILRTRMAESCVRTMRMMPLNRSSAVLHAPTPSETGGTRWNTKRTTTKQKKLTHSRYVYPCVCVMKFMLEPTGTIFNGLAMGMRSSAVAPNRIV